MLLPKLLLLDLPLVELMLSLRWIGRLLFGLFLGDDCGSRARSDWQYQQRGQRRGNFGAWCAELYSQKNSDGTGRPGCPDSP